MSSENLSYGHRPRTNAFSTSLVDRYYTDSSMQAATRTKAQQEKAQQKAKEKQDKRAKWLQEKVRLEMLKVERIQKKLAAQAVAAWTKSYVSSEC